MISSFSTVLRKYVQLARFSESRLNSEFLDTICDRNTKAEVIHLVPVNPAAFA